MDDPILLNLCVILAMAYSTTTDHQILETTSNWCIFLLILVIWPADPLLVAAAAYLASERHKEILREQDQAATQAQAKKSAEHEARMRKRMKDAWWIREQAARAERVRKDAEHVAQERAREDSERIARERAQKAREKEAHESRAREEAARNSRRSSPEPVPPKYWWVHLGVHEQATPIEIKSAYRKLSKECHPDTSTPNVERFRTLTEAYNVAMKVRT